MKQSLRFITFISMFVFVIVSYGQTIYTITSVVISPDGTMVAGTGTNSFLRVWEKSTGNLIVDLTNHSENTQELIRDVTWSPDSRRIATFGMNFALDDNDIRVWNLASDDPQYNIGDFITRLIAHTETVQDLEWSPDGTKLVSLGFEQDGMIIWDASSFNIIHQQARGYLDQLDWNSTGSKFALGYSSSLMMVFDVPSNITANITASTIFNEMFNYYTGISWSPDDTQLVIAESSLVDNSEIRIFDYPSMNETLMIDTGVKNEFHALAWSPAGDMIAGYSEANLMVWDAQTGSLINSYPSNSPGTISFAIAWDDDNNIWYGDVGDYPQIVSPLSTVS